MKHDLTNLLPSGPYWERSDDPFFALLDGLSEVLEKVDDQTIDYIKDCFPHLTFLQLESREREVSLPDPCIKNTKISLEDRRKWLLWKWRKIFVLNGSHASGSYIKEVFRYLFNKKILHFLEHYPTSVGCCAGDDVKGDNWRFHFDVVMRDIISLDFFTASDDKANDPLLRWLNEGYLCFLNKLKPYHTRISNIQTTDNLLPQLENWNRNGNITVTCEYASAQQTYNMVVWSSGTISFYDNDVFDVSNIQNYVISYDFRGFQPRIEISVATQEKTTLPPIHTSSKNVWTNASSNVTLPWRFNSIEISLGFTNDDNPEPKTTSIRNFTMKPLSQ